MMRYAVVSALVTASLGLGTGVATAAQGPHETPNGFIGACNMIRDLNMDNTMTNVIANAGNGFHGNDGMYHAVDVSGGCEA